MHLSFHIPAISEEHLPRHLYTQDTQPPISLLLSSISVLEYVQLVKSEAYWTRWLTREHSPTQIPAKTSLLWVAAEPAAKSTSNCSYVQWPTTREINVSLE